MTTAQTVDEYIALFSQEVQKRLQTMRKTIQAAAPEAKEKIAYGIPTFTFHGNLVHFGGFKNHIGFYPTPSSVEQFADELKDYEVSKGSIKFPHDKPLPLELVKKIVVFRVQERS